MFNIIFKNLKPDHFISFCIKHFELLQSQQKLDMRRSERFLKAFHFLILILES